MILIDGNKILSYTYDMVIIGKTLIKAKESTIEIMIAGDSIGLRVNMKNEVHDNKKKKRNVNRHNISDNRIEQIRYFKYLGMKFDMQNNMYGEINIRLTVENRYYFALAHIFRSKSINKINKYQLYISTFVTYDNSFNICLCHRGNYERWRRKAFKVWVADTKENVWSNL